MFNFLGKRSLGLDISDRSLELIEVNKFGQKLTVTSFARAPLEKGVVSRGRIKDPYKLAAAIKKLAQAAKPKPVDLSRGIHLAIPESQTFLHTFSITKTGEKLDLAAQVRVEVAKTFPLPLEELVWTSELQLESPEAYQVAAAGAAREVITEWREALAEVGIKVTSFDFETLATFRGVFPRGVEALTAVIDLGAVTTTISLFDHAGLFYSYNLDTGGEALTAEVAKTFELSLSAAEEWKVQFGLSDKDKNLALLLTKVLGPTLDELGKLERYLRTTFNQDLAELVLVGGGSYLAGIDEYFARNLKVPVRRGSLASALIVSPKIEGELSASGGLYLEAAGLALKPLLGLSTHGLALPAHF